ncbi:MAG: CvpA family protein [Candidatus Tectomicrobia bacterium]|uniref:CvpA family protein n=1 Tax=Tectimicrobiota bacterium TaxID=2528274 RepID=A0A932M106_UNCTE|nr:CvpA family protein [Candidatus Tectomicrobia bacterium]
MNWLDIILLIILGFGVFKGLRAGFSGQVVSLLSLVVGYVIASKAQQWGANQLTTIFESETGSRILAFLLLFGVGYLATHFAVGRLLEKLLGNRLSLGNRIAGGAIALMKTSIILSFPLIIWILFMPESSFSSLAHSRVRPYLKPALGFTLKFLPEDLKEAYDKRVDDLETEKFPETKQKKGDKTEPGAEKPLQERETHQLKDRRKVEKLIEQ